MLLYNYKQVTENDMQCILGLHLTMHRTIGLTDYYRTISGGLIGYRTNGLMD